MHILMWGNLQYNGAFRHLLSLAGKLSEKHCEVSVFLPTLPADLKKKLTHQHPYLQVITEREKAVKLIKKGRVSAVHLHGLEDLLTAEKISKKFRLPLLVTLHGPPHRFYETRLRRSPLLSGLITTSYSFWKSFTGSFPACPAWFIPEGVDLSTWKPATTSGVTRDFGNTSGFRLLYVGEENSIYRYSLQLLGKAAELAGEELHVLGPQKPASMLGRYHGRIFDPLTYLKRAEIVFAAGRAAAEAMSCGCPTAVLGKFYGGIAGEKTLQGTTFPDLTGHAGIESCYREIFYDLRDLIKDSNLREKVQTQARNFAVKNFDLELVAEQTARVYRQTLKSGALF